LVEVKNFDVVVLENREGLLQQAIKGKYSAVIASGVRMHCDLFRGWVRSAKHNSSADVTK
jgi:hypothetical protein